MVSNITIIDYLFIVVAYLIGSIPFGLIITKLAGIEDIRKQGSGNIGATNVMRVAGKKLSLITFILDSAKGAIITLVAKYFLANPVVILLVAFSSVIGHVFSIWLKFKGGKGVATAIAVILVCKWPLGLITALIWLTVFFCSRISSLASIISFSLLPFIDLLFSYNKYQLYFVTMIAILILFRHYNNFKNLLKGREKPL